MVWPGMYSNVVQMKATLVTRIAKKYGGDTIFSKLLSDNFSRRDLSVLEMYPDISRRILGISRLRTGPLKMFLESNYGLQVDEFDAPDKTGECDWWIGMEGLRERLPVFDRIPRSGWYVDKKDFVYWAQSFIVREMRMNVLIRYIEYKRKTKTFTSS